MESRQELNNSAWHLWSASITPSAPHTGAGPSLFFLLRMWLHKALVAVPGHLLQVSTHSESQPC